MQISPVPHIQSLLTNGNLKQAITACRQALLYAPGNVEIGNLLALSLMRNGELQDALDVITKLAKKHSKNTGVLLTYGLVLKERKEFEAALQVFFKCLEINPRSFDAQFETGAVLTRTGRHTEGLRHLNEAIALNPKSAEARNVAGIALKELGHYALAEAAFRDAIQIAPQFVQAIKNLARLLVTSNPLEALRQFNLAASLSPRDPQIWDGMGLLLTSLGKPTEAISCLNEAQRLSPRPERQLALALIVPRIAESNAAIEVIRSNLEHNLDQLLKSNLVVSDLGQLGATGFYLAYHGRNNSALLSKFSRAFRHCCPDLNFTARHTQTGNGKRKVRKIGFFSRFVADHPVSKAFAGLVNTLAEEREFSVHMLSMQPLSTIQASDFSSKNIIPVEVPTNIVAAQKVIENYELDVLIYLEIGMDMPTYLLAHARLAPIQCVVPGHPDTSGISTIDYYLSTEGAEVKNADSHYSEKLVRLPFGFFHFEKPTYTRPELERADFQLPESGPVYLCPVTIFKLHPDFDGIVKNILELDKVGHVAFVVYPTYITYNQLILDRLSQCLGPELIARVLFIPWAMGFSKFTRLLEVASVILDPVHFGIGTTGIAIFTAGTPYVTMPTEFARGRVGTYFYKLIKMGEECIATDYQDYAKKAVAIANDLNIRNRIKNQMLSRGGLLYGKNQAASDLTKFLSELTF